MKELEKFGHVEKTHKTDKEYEFYITQGFSKNANNTFECLRICTEIAKDYPYVQKLITEENMFHLILSKKP